ncbi:MAG TPA: sialidase family protein [Candidatus Thermoplasmatota archaeon]|nr:sialidase family protein [Candidatus Thermoplasmatota archaeon]
MQTKPALLALVLLAAGALAGCIQAGNGPLDAASNAPAFDPATAPRLLAHEGVNRTIDPAVLFDPLLAPGANGSALFDVAPSLLHVSVGVPGAEPSIGVTSNGMIFFQGIGGEGPTGMQPATMRSVDGGRTWKNVIQLPATMPISLDPLLWVDPDTDRVFVNHLYVGCSWLSWSDDFGGSWTTNPLACGNTLNDHQKIATGKFKTLPNPGVYKNVVYYGYNQIGGNPATGASRVSASLDGGLTWPINSKAVEHGTCSGGLHGRLRTDSEGNVYLPKRDCGGVVLAVSKDNALTWTQTKLGEDVGSARFRKNPDLAIDRENNLYMVWPGDDNRLYLSVSRDRGATWSNESLLASPPSVTTTTMPAIVAGDAGRIAFAYYGVENGNGKSPECVGDETTWNVYVSWSLDALSENPRFVTTTANDPADPVQVGGISTNSGTPEGGCKYRRNLLDFIDMTMDKEGRVYVATADGCVNCTGQSDSNNRLGMASTQLTGPSLLFGTPAFREGPTGKAAAAPARPGAGPLGLLG